jgi:membrane-bound lytic murein transglycosylase F
MFLQDNINLIRSIIAGVLLLTVTGCSIERPTHLEQIRQNGEIRFAMLEGPATYFQDEEIISGLDYELASQFAKKLGVNLRVISVTGVADIVNMIRNGQADVGASGTALTSLSSAVITGPAYQEVTWHMIYNRHTPRPEMLASIRPGQLVIAEGSQFTPQLEILKNAHAQLTWNVQKDKDTQKLLGLLNQRKIDLTIADSVSFAYYQQLYPDTRIAFDLTDPQLASWIYKNTSDDTLDRIINDFFYHLGSKGELEQLNERYRGYLDNFDYVDSRAFIKRVSDRLPKYQVIFKDSAEKTGMDWRLLAALSYQESHWNPEARSKTGVRGMMMLTRKTATQVGINNRLEPGQSISGGATYLKKMMQRIPSRIPEPDHTWFAIAAYNVGFGHLEDARIITQKLGGNPDSWFEVKKNLPLLKRKEWYSQTRYGYARGNEPVTFVSHIRKYYDILRLLLKDESVLERENTGIPVIAALLIDSPVL